MDYSSKQAAIESVREAVARGRAVIEVDNEVVWLHPDKVHSVNSVYASDEQGAITLYAILGGQAMGYDWAYEAHGLRKPDQPQPQPNVIPGTLIVLSESVGYGLGNMFNGLVVALTAFSPMDELGQWLDANPEQRGDKLEGFVGNFDWQAFVNNLKARNLVADVPHGVFTLKVLGSPDEANFVMDD